MLDADTFRFKHAMRKASHSLAVSVMVAFIFAIRRTVYTCIRIKSTEKWSMIMKLAVIGALLCGALAFGQDGKQAPKLTADQKATIEAANQQALIAQYLSRIAELERQVASLQVQVVIAQACSGADLKLSECEVKPDGTVNKKSPDAK